MDSEEIIKVIDTLIGDIEPVADSAIDKEREENLGKYIDVLWHMYSEISHIASRHKNSPYGSQKRLGELCDKTLKQLKDELIEYYENNNRKRR